MYGIITGSGFYDVPQLTDRRQTVKPTPYGEALITEAVWSGVRVAFLARHGTGHSVAPHRINYRANIWALHDLAVDGIIATAVCGGIDPVMTPGSLVIIDDFLNFTDGREDTFFDGHAGLGSVVDQHTDMSNPYDPVLRRALIGTAGRMGIDVLRSGTYCATNGPRFESRAEIRMASLVGGQLVGMTGYPEVVLANELSVPYASIGVISNRAAGLGSAELALDDIMRTLESVTERLYTLIERTIIDLAATRSAAGAP